MRRSAATLVGVVFAVASALMPEVAAAQSAITFQYVYDQSGQLTKVIDSTGVVIEYVYDAVGNMLEVRRSNVDPGTLTIADFTPSRGGPGTLVTIRGLRFSDQPSANVVTFNGVPSTVVSATPSLIVASVPPTATTGLINVVVGAGSVNSSAPFTVVALPVVTSVTPKVIDSSRAPAFITLTGSNLGGSQLKAAPALAQPIVTLGTPQFNAGGKSATVPIILAANARGVFVVVATNAEGSSSSAALVGNTLTIFDAQSDVDSDGDGFPDGLELVLGSDPQDSNSIPNLAVTGDIVSSAFSVSNIASPSGVQQSIVSAAVSVSNLALPPTIQQTLISAAFSVSNTAVPFTTPVTMVSAAFSVSNTAMPFTAAVTMVSPAFSVSNLALLSTPQALVSPAFSVFNDNTVTTTPASVDSLKMTDDQVMAVRIDQPLGQDVFVEGDVIAFTAVVSAAPTDTVVTFTVNGQRLITDTTRPYALQLTAPASMESLTFGVTARTPQGVEAFAIPVSVQVVPDPTTTVSGRVVDGAGNPIADALVDLLSVGLKGEFFRLAQQPKTLPDLDGLQADRVGRVTGVSMWNPGGQFGADPFGAGLAPDYAARFTGWLNVTAAGRYTFFLNAHEGARLRINDGTVIEVPIGSGGPSELSGAIDLAPGLVPIELTFFESGGNAEIVLSYVVPGGERQVVPPTAFVPGATPFVARTDADGYFEITGVPTALKSIQARATISNGAETASATSDAAMSLPPSGVNVGVIVIVRQR